MIKKVLTILFIIIFFSNYYWGQNVPYATFSSSTNSYIDFGAGTNLNCFDTLSQGDQLSITLWVRWGNFNDPGVGPWSNLFTMSDSTNSGDNGVWWIQHNNNNSKFEFALHTTSRSFVFSKTNPVAGIWFHLACIYNGNQIQIYINGILDNSKNKSGNIRPYPLASKLNMGRWPNPGNNYRRFNGDMDEISIWNIALSPTQINNMMTNPESVIGVNYDTTGILGYWNFDNSTANDLSPCENNGLVGIGAALPIELLNFDGVWKDDNVTLTWTTLTEINNNYFTIERSCDASYWIAINEISGAGNSSSPLTYFAKDDINHLNSSLPIYYRLKQTDFDGSSTYYNVIVVNQTTDIKIQIANKMLFITGIDSTQPLTLVVINNSGQKVYEEVILYDKKVYLKSLNVGIYFYFLIYKEKVIHEKFIVR
ncbi:MAG: T9SS type A sorting domain-containing protein [Flavobacteriales bacterium]|nr:T9SS type A sorting domain-containing protein [Flavobacteriales bacterium]